MGWVMKNIRLNIGIRHDVAGAPFKIGDIVKVILLADETANARFFGKHGEVVWFEYSCGCGQTYPNDPMIGVQFKSKVEEFWKEEIALVRKPHLRRKFLKDS
jgi:hypothetical protein